MRDLNKIFLVLLIFVIFFQGALEEYYGAPALFGFFFVLIAVIVIYNLYIDDMERIFQYKKTHSKSGQIKQEDKFHAMRRETNRVYMITKNHSEDGIKLDEEGMQHPYPPLSITIHKKEFEIYFSELQIQDLNKGYETIVLFEPNEIMDSKTLQRKIESYIQEFKSEEFIVVLAERFPGERLSLVEHMKKSITLSIYNIEYHLVPENLYYKLVPHYVNCDGKWACPILRPSLVGL